MNSITNHFLYKLISPRKTFAHDLAEPPKKRYDRSRKKSNARTYHVMGRFVEQGYCYCLWAGC